jgi:hypothetical protein
MSLFSWGMQGHDIVPKQIAGDFEQLFRQYLPGWAVDTATNYSAAPSTQAAGVQLNRIMQSGGHSWYNTALDDLLLKINDGLGDLTVAAREAAKTQRLAALVNFLNEAQNPANIDAGGKTGGYVAFLSKRDPLLISGKGLIPDTDWMNNYHATNLSWEKVMSSGAASDVIALNPEIDPATGKLTYNGKLSGTGFFSHAASEIDGIPKMTSTEFSAKWAADNGIKMNLDGSISEGSGAIRMDRERALEYLDQEIGGHKISSVGWIPKGLLSKLSKLGPVALVAVIGSAALTATSAQAGELYDTNEAEPANRKFIATLIGEALSELAGIVAGALAGMVSLGALAIPTAIAVSEAATRFGEYLGGLFYDTFTATANAIAETVAPFFSSIAQSALDLASVIYNVVSDIADFMEEYVTGPEGLFGLQGPLFGEGAPLDFVSQYFEGESIFENKGIWAYDGFDAELEGADADDVLIHDGWGSAFGGKGDDFLIGWGPDYKHAGDQLFEEDPNTLAVRSWPALWRHNLGDGCGGQSAG